METILDLLPAAIGLVAGVLVSVLVRRVALTRLARVAARTATQLDDVLIATLRAAMPLGRAARPRSTSRSEPFEPSAVVMTAWSRAAAPVAYDAKGWQPEFVPFIPQMTVDFFVNTRRAAEYKTFAADTNGSPELVRKPIALEKEPMAWEKDVRHLKTPVLIIAGDADVGSRAFGCDVPLVRRRCHGRHGQATAGLAPWRSCRRHLTRPSSPSRTCCIYGWSRS